MNPTTHEIMELARLDALGMLDTDERVVFERAFQDASPALREQIRREQNRLTDISDLLPDVEPPQDLRGRVLHAVRDAMTAVTGRTSGDVLARIEPLAVNMRRNVSPVWRAACIGFATATILLMGISFSQHTTYEDALQAVRDGELAEQIAIQLGSQFHETFFSPTADHVAFIPVADSTAVGKSSVAKVMIDHEKEIALLVCDKLPRVDGQYALVITDEEGKVISTVARFDSNGVLESQTLPNNIMASARYAICTTDATTNEPGEPVLVSL